jgi:hypothetical protein
MLLASNNLWFLWYLPILFLLPLPPLSTDVLGHPFGKVPPSRPFDGCTPTEAEVVLTDPANPVGKTLLAGEPHSSPPLLLLPFSFLVSQYCGVGGGRRKSLSWLLVLEGYQ